MQLEVVKGRITTTKPRHARKIKHQFSCTVDNVQLDVYLNLDPAAIADGPLLECVGFNRTGGKVEFGIFPAIRDEYPQGYVRLVIDHWDHMQRMAEAKHLSDILAGNG